MRRRDTPEVRHNRMVEVYNRNRIPVTYQCVGCGSERTELEDTDLPIPSKVVWNLCDDCQAMNKNNKGGK